MLRKLQASSPPARSLHVSAPSPALKFLGLKPPSLIRKPKKEDLSAREDVVEEEKPGMSSYIHSYPPRIFGPAIYPSS